MSPLRMAMNTENIRRIDSDFPRMKRKRDVLESNHIAPRCTEEKQDDKQLQPQLPDDCLYTIFSMLDRRTLNTLKRVSKRTHRIANEFCKKVKKRARELVLMRDCDGYSVILTGSVLHTHTLRSGNADCGTKADGKWEIKRKYKKDVDFYDEDWVEFDSPLNTCRYCDSPKSFPLQYYTLVKKFTDNFTFDQLTLINITIDDKFLDLIAPLFEGSVMQYGLGLFNSPIHESISIEKLSHFMASLNPGRILPSDPNFPWSSLDEQFLIGYPSTKLALSVIKSHYNKIHGFSPTSDFAPVLSRFEKLQFPGLILKPKVIFEALKMRLASSDRLFVWELSSNSIEFDLSCFDTDTYRVTSNDRYGIEMKKRDLKGIISINIDEPRDAEFYPYHARISFFPPSKWTTYTDDELAWEDVPDQRMNRPDESDDESNSEEEVDMELDSEA